MENAKKDRYELLATVIDALYNKDQEVKVETTDLDANKAKKYAWNIVDTPQIPTRQGSYKTGAWSKNHEHAQSIKIGKISMRRMQGGKYILRTPEGEAEFSQNDKDFVLVWSAALTKSDFNPSTNPRDTDMYHDIMTSLYKHVKEPVLKDAAGKGLTRDKKSKFDKAKENLKALGIEANEEELKKRQALIKNKYLEK